MQNKKDLLVAIVGPTAVGKSEVAIEIAQKIGSEIVSADSMQIYRYMDIGTAKPTIEERELVPHHMIDIVYPDEEFSAADFQKRAKSCIKSIYQNDKIPLVVGGTGFYINALCYDYTFSPAGKDESLREHLKKEAEEKGVDYLYNQLVQIDPEAAAKIHPNNLRRIIRALEVCKTTGKPFSYYVKMTKMGKSPYDLLIFGLTMPRDELYRRINKRVVSMIEKGFIDEVEKLLEMGYDKNLKSMQGLGYRQVIQYLEGRLTLDEAIDLIARDTRRYAKRQYTWFLRDQNIIWLDILEQGKEKIAAKIIESIEGKTRNT